MNKQLELAKLVEEVVLENKLDLTYNTPETFKHVITSRLEIKAKQIIPQKIKNFIYTEIDNILTTLIAKGLL